MGPYERFRTGKMKLPFQLFLVGGAVRDLYLGREPKDRDFVAVGATQEQFLKAFPDAQIIGKSFPVYLVPGLGEVAFARKERKLGPYHTDYEVLFDPSISLKEDLSRRDLTINAMALEPDPVPRDSGLPGWQVFDPFNGLVDLKAKVLRHVGPAFSEDALRVYRLARFAAQLNFTVAPETVKFAHQVALGDLLSLPGERVCEEFRKAMRSPWPSRFVKELEHLSVLGLHFQELAHLRSVPAGSQEHHPEGDALTHSLMALDWVNKESRMRGCSEDEYEVLGISTLFHDLGKGATDPAKWPAHHGHDEAGVPLVEALCGRLKLPTAITKAAVMVCREHMRVHLFVEMNKGKRVDLIQAADKTVLKAEGLALCCAADSNGRDVLPEVRAVSQQPARLMSNVAHVCREEKGQPVPVSLVGKAIGLHIRARKGTAVNRALKEFQAGLK